MSEAAGQCLSCWKSEILLLGRVFKSKSDLVLKFLSSMQLCSMQLPCTKLCYIWLCSMWLLCGKLCCTWFWCLFLGKTYLVYLSVSILIVCLFDWLGLLSQIVKLLSRIASISRVIFFKLCCTNWDSIFIIFFMARGSELHKMCQLCILANVSSMFKYVFCLF